MSPRMLVVAALATVVLASSGGCDGLPGGSPSIPDIPTSLPTSIPTQIPTEIPTEIPELPGGGDGTTAAPAPPATPEETGEAAPAPVDPTTEPVPGETVVAPGPDPSASAEPGPVAEAVEGIPWWVWLLLVLLVVGLVAAVIALRRAKAAELRWAALWHDLTGEARWLDERVVPAVQDRALDPATLTNRWQDGARRFDDLDRRVWAAANEETKPARVADLNALSAALVRLREAVDTEVSLRTSGVEQPGLWDAAQTVADARDELRRQVNTRTR
jgi:hypothetical protein